MRRWQILVALAALVGGVLLLSSPVCRMLGGCRPSQTDIEATAQVDSLPQWKREAADSQRVLDSLARDIAKVRADSARVARQLKAIRRTKDSLAGLTANRQAALESIPPLNVGASASDSAQHFTSIAIGQGHVIRTMADEITACRQGDMVYEGRLADLEGALSKCERRAGIFEQQRNDAQIRLDRAVGLLDKQLAEKRHADDWHLPLGIRLPGWTKCVALGAGGTAVGAVVDQTRGAVLGGGSALLGCLVG